MKRILQRTVLSCLFAFIGMTAFAYDCEVNGIYYNLNTEDNTASIAKGDCGGVVNIPESITYNDIAYTVISIGFEAFRNCDSLTKVVIPNSVTTIDKWAFAGCKGLTELTIGNSVTSIGNAAFAGCTGLEEITIPNSVISIGEDAFNWCSSLATLAIGNSVITIGEYAFSYCSSLTTVIIPNSVTTIDLHAFRDCDALTVVNIGSGVTSINYPFVNCGSLKKITVEEDNSYYDSREDCNAIIRTSDNELIIGCKTTHIPNSVTSIGDGAFYSCSNLKEITIPNSVTTIGVNAFTDCGSLTEITIPNSVTSIGCPNFNACNGLERIVVEDGNLYYDSRDNCNAIIHTDDNELIAGCQSTRIPNSVTSIRGYAFLGCTGLTAVAIPNGVTSIGECAFLGCTGLTTVTIPNSVTFIGEYAFRDCSGLTTVSFGNSITSIGNWSFDGCYSLTSITSLNPVPPIINWWTFDLTAHYYAILHVPAGYKEVYQQAEHWSDFINIQDDATDGIESIAADKQVKNKIYTLDGKRLPTTNTANLPCGIYVINGKKVMVK